MEFPAPQIVKQAFNWKFLLVVLVLVVLITIVLNKFFTTEMTLTDTSGKVFGTGKINKSLNYSVQKTATT